MPWEGEESSKAGNCDRVPRGGHPGDEDSRTFATASGSCVEPASGSSMNRGHKDTAPLTPGPRPQPSLWPKGRVMAGRRDQVEPHDRKTPNDIRFSESDPPTHKLHGETWRSSDVQTSTHCGGEA